MSVVSIIHHICAQANAEKMAKGQEAQLAEFQMKLDEQQRSIFDLNNNKSKMLTETDDLTTQLEDAESQIAQLSKVIVTRELY